MNRVKQVALDAAVAAGLAAALVVVARFDRAPAKAPAGPAVQVKAVEDAAPVLVRPLRLAVTPRQYDDMGKLLRQLGEGYKFTTVRLEDLEDPERVARFDVIFATCGTVPDSWVRGEPLADGSRPGVQRFRANEEAEARVRESLRRFVGRGGTLYASDWRLDLLRWVFPEFFESDEVERGVKQTLTARVVDAGLRDVIGPELALRFDLGGWYPAALSAPDMTTYLDGEYRDDSGATLRAPLLVKIPFEQGTVIFTSFHNEKQNSAKELDLLRFLVFAAVTAKETARAQKTMVSGGFSPQKQNLLSASAERPSVTQRYRHEKAGGLRFALSFEPRGARLWLTVEGPGGRKAEQEGTSTFALDVPAAAPGDWKYTVTALQVPYPNFPFTLTVGGE